MANAHSGTAGSVVYLTGGTALVGAIGEWSLNLEHNPVETTALGEDWLTYIASIRSATGAFSGNFDQSDAQQAALFAATDAIALRMYLSVDTYINIGTALLTDMGPSVGFDGSVETAFDFVASGPVTFVSWLLDAEFTTDRAVGAVNGAAAEVGPGTIVATDSNGKLSIANGALTVVTGGASIDPLSILSPGASRAVGRIFLFAWTVTANRAWLGLVNSSSVTPGTMSAARRGTLEQNTTGLYVITSNSPSINVATVALSTAYKLCILTRSTGQMYLIKGGTFTFWVLLYIDASNTDATLYPYATQIGTTTAYALDYIRVPAVRFLPAPLASDGFGSTFGATDGLGHAEGVSGGMGSGGGNVSWTLQAGTLATATGRLGAIVLAGGIAVATVATVTAAVFCGIKLTRSAGQGGLVLRYTDANNYLYANHDGTNAFVKQVLAGATTTLVTGAATYSANAAIVVDLTGTSARLYYNNALVGSSSAVDAALTATNHGVYVTDVTANLTLDDFFCYAKGSGGEYSILDMLSG